jgi:hypothetical protein
MDTLNKARMTLRPSSDRRTLDGAWWPCTRELEDELVSLFAAWPRGAGYISRVIVAPRDWDSTPSRVRIPGRRGLVKTDLLPKDTTHHAVLIMLDGERRSLVVIPPDASRDTAAKFLGAFGDRRVADAPYGPNPSLVTT